jgi:hypothetical protein
MKKLLLLALLACSFSLSAQKVIKIGVGGGGSMSSTQVKDSLLANTDTNVLTDAEQTKLGYLTISGVFDADAIKVTAAGSEQWTNKRDDLLSPNTTTYPTTNAVANALTNAELLGTETATTSRTAVLTDADGIVEITSGSNVTYTIPQNADVAFPVGTLLMLRRNGSGNIAVAYSGTATGDSASTYKYGETISLRKVDTDEWVILNPPRPDYESYMIACSDLTTDITTGTGKAYFDMPHSMTFTNCSVSLLGAGTSTGITVDINENGTSVLSTKLTTDATETTSLTAATPYVISDADLANGARITFDFDGVPTGAKGVIVTITGYR